jgi:hypothetical protein
MNWLGLTTVAFLTALLGALFGSVAYAAALASGWDAPYLVGLATGLGALLGSPDRSAMRGLLVATGALWVAAIVQTRLGPHAGSNLLTFHATLTPTRLAAFAACGATAFLLARLSARRGAPLRTAGA